MVGLGNPGRRYEQTRHNVGFLVADELARRLELPAWKSKDGALQAHSAARRIVIAKPQLFMNNSGPPVAAMVSWWKVDLPNLLIVYDDLDLPLGKLRMRASGSSGGQNGIRSILAMLGTNDVPRLRVGIGRGRDAIDHVLAPFEPAERPQLERITAAAADSAERWLSEPFERAAQWANSWSDEV